MEIDYSEWKRVGDLGVQHRAETLSRGAQTPRRAALPLEREVIPAPFAYEPQLPSVYAERYERDFWIQVPYTGTEDSMSLKAIGLLALWWGKKGLSERFGDGRVDDFAMWRLFHGNPEQFRQLLIQLYHAGHIRSNADGEWELTPLRERGYQISRYNVREDDRVLWEATHMPRPTAAQPGFVYLMYDAAYRYYKIGYSRSPERRRRQLNKRLPGLGIRHVIETDDMERLEYGWHKALAEWRIDGEWFDIPDEVIEQFLTFRCIVFDPARVGARPPFARADLSDFVVDAWGRPL